MGRILVVDDDRDMRGLLTALLTEAGHEVATAVDGVAALGGLETFTPDLIVLDVMMPGSNGYEVLAEMKRTGIKGPIRTIMLSALAAEADWLRAYQLGADAYITKPFDVEELLTKVAELLSIPTDDLQIQRDDEIDRAKLLGKLERVFA